MVGLGISEPSTVPYLFSNRVLRLKLALRYNSTKPTVHLQGDSNRDLLIPKFGGHF